MKGSHRWQDTKAKGPGAVMLSIGVMKWSNVEFRVIRTEECF